MRIALVGYGKMGRVLESLAPDYGGEVVLRLDEHNNRKGEAITPVTMREVDVAIEFTAPDVAVGNLQRLAASGTATVTGTTGWYHGLDEITAQFRNQGSSLIYSPNFSIGVNLFDRLTAEAARLLENHPDYGCWAWEIHHDEKKDAPSGTMKSLIETMRRAGYSHPVDVSSSRAGKVPGTHEIGFDSAADTIQLRHTARSREGFARGALYAARWLLENPGVYSFQDVLFGTTGAKETQR